MNQTHDAGTTSGQFIAWQLCRELRADNATSGLRLDDNEYYVTVADCCSLFGVVNEQENKPTKERQKCLVLRIESSPATYR